MTEYRAFRNTDPPALAEVWRSQPKMRALFPAMNAKLLEEHVLAKPYFDRQGLTVAVEQDSVVGFAHAALGPSSNLSALDPHQGVISMIMVSHDKRMSEIGSELLARSETYLQQLGATSIHGGGCYPCDPFYQGFYGGASLSGVLASHPSLLELLQSHGYQVQSERLVLQRSLAGFRPLVNRDQMQIRRRFQVLAEEDPHAPTWWQACTGVMHDQTRFHLTVRQPSARSIARPGLESSAASAPTDQHEGLATFWDMEPLASSWGVHATGLIQWWIEPSKRRQGLATFLLGEALRHQQNEGRTLVEVHVPSDDQASLALFRKLGFETVDRAYELLKQL